MRLPFSPSIALGCSFLPDYRMAKEYGLILKYKEEFHGIFEEHQDDPEFGDLMVRMNVVDTNGESSMDEDQWEAASKSGLLETSW